MKRSTLVLLYSSYSYLLNLGLLLLELSPYPVRILVFRLLLGKLERTY